MKEQCFFLGLEFILNLLDSLLFMEEVVEHLVMATGPPCYINGVYLPHLVCMGLHREVALFLVAGILTQRAKELKKHRYFVFHSVQFHFYCKFVVSVNLVGLSGCCHIFCPIILMVVKS